MMIFKTGHHTAKAKPTAINIILRLIPKISTKTYFVYACILITLRATPIRLPTSINISQKIYTFPRPSLVKKQLPISILSSLFSCVDRNYQTVSNGYLFSSLTSRSLDSLVNVLPMSSIYIFCDAFFCDRIVYTIDITKKRIINATSTFHQIVVLPIFEIRLPTYLSISIQNSRHKSVILW